jgi:hypothetical protein
LLSLVVVVVVAQILVVKAAAALVAIELLPHTLLKQILYIP